jgi:phytoene dehydrogenase-like protein
MSERFDAVVVGAGHNGLACAGYLAKSGRKVLVLEAAEKVGGAAVTHEFYPGFRVSACAHLLHMLHPIVAAELELGKQGLEFAAADLDTIALAPDGRHLRLNGRRLEGEAISQAERAAYSAFVDRLGRFAAVLESTFTRRPPRLVNGEVRDNLALARLAWRVRGLGRDDMRELLRIGAINIYDVLQEEFQSELLKGAIAFDAVLGTHMGPRSPNSVLTLLHRMTGRVGRDGSGLSQPRGGLGAVTEAMRKSAEQAGAVIRTANPVAAVEVESGRATGVRTLKGETIGAALVVSNADPKTTFLSLVGARKLETAFVRRIHNIRMRGNAAKLHLALSGPPEFRGVETAALGARFLIAPTLDYLELGFDQAKYGDYSAAPAMEITVPTARDAALAQGGGHVLSATVQYAPHGLRRGWDGSREAFKEIVIDRIGEFAPAIRKSIVHAELLTPADIERRFRITGGQWHHGEYTLDQFMMLRPVPGAAQYASPVEGLWLCGAGAHPGGGVMGLPGRNAAMEILRGGAA